MREFDRTKDCVKCKRYIDEIEVKLKKLTIGEDTYRQYNPKYLEKIKYEKLCTDCASGKTVAIENTNES